MVKTRYLGWVVAVGFALFVESAHAQPWVGFDPIYSNDGAAGGAQLIGVYAPEFHCPAGYPNCVFNLQTTLPAGYDPEQVDVILNWFQVFTGGTPVMAKRLNVQLTKLNYNQSTGQFNWRVTGSLLNDSTQGFGFSLEATIIMADGVSAFIKRVSPSCTGSVSDLGAYGVSCYSNNTFYGVEPWWGYLHGFALQGFSLNTPNSIEIGGVGVDVSFSSPGIILGSHDLFLTCSLDTLIPVSNPPTNPPPVIPFTCGASALAISTSQPYSFFSSSLGGAGFATGIGGTRSLQSPPAVGTYLPLAAIQAFDIRFENQSTGAPESRPIHSFGAECGRPYGNGSGGYIYDWTAFLSGDSYPGSYQSSQMSCLDGYFY